MIYFIIGYDSDDEDEEEDRDEEWKRKQLHLLKQIRQMRAKPTWKWMPRHFTQPWKPGKRGHPIFQVCRSHNIPF